MRFWNGRYVAWWTHTMFTDEPIPERKRTAEDFEKEIEEYDLEEEEGPKDLSSTREWLRLRIRNRWGLYNFSWVVRVPKLQ